jgi:hypothetical protein
MKIPFEQTIAGAYRFAFSNILSVFGIGWFPLALFAVGTGAAVIGILPLFGGLIREGTNQIDTARLGAVIGPIAGTCVLVLCAMIVAQAMVNVGMMRKALGQHPGPVFIFFSLGRQVWQLIGSYLLLMLLAWGMIALAVGAITAVSLALQKFAPAAQIAVTVLLVIVAYIWGIYAIVRVSFFLPAVVVAENHISLRRAWHLGKGNFWRILGILIIVTVPPSIAVSTIMQSILPLLVAGPPVVLSPQGPTAAEAHAFVERMMTVFVKAGPYMGALEFLYVIVASGLLAGAVAAAYNGVTGSASAKAPG